MVQFCRNGALLVPAYGATLLRGLSGLNDAAVNSLQEALADHV